MPITCVESKFELIQSQGWIFASHIFFRINSKVSTFSLSQLGVIQIVFSHWFFFPRLAYQKIYMPAPSSQCGHFTVVLCACNQEPWIQRLLIWPQWWSPYSLRSRTSVRRKVSIFSWGGWIYLCVYPPHPHWWGLPQRWKSRRSGSVAEGNTLGTPSSYPYPPSGDTYFVTFFCRERVSVFTTRM